MTCGKIMRASAPAKVMLFGEHFVVYGSPAILGAIDRRVQATARCINSAEINISSNVGFSTSYSSQTVEEPRLHYSEGQRFLYPLYAAIYGILKDHLVERNIGVRVDITSDIPWGAGLGSSAASCVATVAAVGSLFDKPQKGWVYSMAQRAEKIIHKNPSGADCYISTFGGLIYYIKKRQNRKIRSKRDLSLVVINTGIRHSTKAQISLVKDFRIQNRPLFNSLSNHVTRICNEAVSAIGLRDKKRLGDLMNENHSLLSELGISNDEVNDLVKLCLDNGALGAKLTGAGGGGSVIALLPDKFQADFITKMGKKKSSQCIPVKIGSGGLLIY
jgi:mevalonate kinase